MQIAVDLLFLGAGRAEAGMAFPKHVLARPWRFHKFIPPCLHSSCLLYDLGTDEGLCHRLGRRRRLLPGLQRHRLSG